MKPAFTFITVQLGQEKFVKSEISKIQNVKKASEVFGAYDIVVEIAGTDTEDIKGTVHEIRKIKPVRATMTVFPNRSWRLEI